MRSTNVQSKKMRSKKMPSIALMVAATILLPAALLAAPTVSQPAPFPGVLRNAQYVYVTSFDGSQWNFNVSPDDRVAISELQDEIRSWGKLMVVQKPQDADMILVVQKRGSEDELAVFDARLDRGMYLWRVMAKSGLVNQLNRSADKKEMPLFTQFREAFEKSEANGKK